MEFESTERILKWEESLPREYWAYRSKWINYPKFHTLMGSPIHLDIEATSACNMQCIMCPRTELVEDGKFWEIENFDLDLYKRIIDESVPNGLCSVKYNFLGEPTLNPDLVEMIRYAKDAGVVDVMFNTNGTMLSEEMSVNLIESGLDKLFLSFDSPYKKDYERIRVGGGYDEVLANIKRFMEIRESYGLVPFVRVAMCLMDGNENGKEDFVKLFEPIVDCVSFITFTKHTGQKTDYTIHTGTKTEPYVCPYLWQRMFIHPDGVVTPCCVDSMRTLYMGNINKESVEDIWLGEKYQLLRKLHTTGKFNELPACAECPLAIGSV